MKNLTHHQWQAGPGRCLLESCLLGLGLLALSITMLGMVDPIALSLFFVMLSLICAAWAALRLRAFKGSLLIFLLKECIFAAMLNTLLVVAISSILNLSNNQDLLYKGYGDIMSMALIACIPMPAYLAIRTAFHLWRYWDRLRRQRFMWSLIDVILKIMAASGAAILLPITFLFVIIKPYNLEGYPPASLFAWVVVGLFFFITFYAMALLTGIAVLLPPAVFISYLAAHKLVRRLENLAASTHALSEGNLDSRVKVEGEDEIAHLQMAFNRMAEQNQKFTGDLEAEKEKVTGILSAHRQMVADISHELRNPAAAIIGYSESLQENWSSQDSETVTHDLKIITHEARRLHTILNDLLDAAQIETGRLSLDLQPVEIVGVASAVIETFSSTAWMGKRVQVSLSSSEKIVRAIADETRLEQVLVNLVQNAIQHTSPGGLVAIDIRQEEQTIQITIEDTGEGIPLEDVPYIFNRFYRSKSVDQTGRHTGLGLALVKDLTEAMGGKVTLESQPGSGSRFTVHLCRPATTAE